jgi:hypothetical protein
MAHFARVVDGKVTEVIVAEQDFADTLPGQWIQTSYNTYGNQHPESRPLRKNYAGVGYSYDAVRDAFIPPKPFESWLLDDDTCLWEAPVPMPTDGKVYGWDESTVSWKELEMSDE